MKVNDISKVGKCRFSTFTLVPRDSLSYKEAMLLILLAYSEERESNRKKKGRIHRIVNIMSQVNSSVLMAPVRRGPFISVSCPFDRFALRRTDLCGKCMDLSIQQLDRQLTLQCVRMLSTLSENLSQTS